MYNLDRKDATKHTKEFNARFLSDNSLSMDNDEDFGLVTRGLIAKLDPPIIQSRTGNVIFSGHDYDFLDGGTPPTINPSLLRQARLNAYHGLFKVTDGLYQVRGYDISNVTFIEGKTGYILIDASESEERAEAAMRLVYQHLGEKPILAVIYTHSHMDHWGGIKGIVSEEDVEAGMVRIIAPENFMKYTVSEVLLAGNATGCRAKYQFGERLPFDEKGAVDVGLGKTSVAGKGGLIEPTESISETGEAVTIDGVELVFQLTPETEAQAEMNIFLPQFKALCMAENCTHTLHNLYTLRGTPVRDAKGWSYYINEAIELFADKTEVVFATHHWPIWGNEKLREYLKKQRDIYKYIHDQSLRLLNHGYTMLEVAENLKLPKSLSGEWYLRGNYGSVNHNAKAIYQWYIGFYDGNPATLYQLPPEDAGKKYVEFMGGSEAVLKRAQKAFDDGDYRWVAQVVNHVVFAEPDNMEARALQADALEQLGYQAESAPWRNEYLSGAAELRSGLTSMDPAKKKDHSKIAGNVRAEDLFDLMAIRLNGLKAEGLELIINFCFTDINEKYRVVLENSVLCYDVGKQAENPDLTLSMRKRDLARLSQGELKLEEEVDSGRVIAVGDLNKFKQLLTLLDSFELSFNIVTP